MLFIYFAATELWCQLVNHELLSILKYSGVTCHMSHLSNSWSLAKFGSFNKTTVPNIGSNLQWNGWKESRCCNGPIKNHISPWVKCCAGTLRKLCKSKCLQTLMNTKKGGATSLHNYVSIFSYTWDKSWSILEPYNDQLSHISFMYNTLELKVCGLQISVQQWLESKP